MGDFSSLRLVFPLLLAFASLPAQAAIFGSDRREPLTEASSYRNWGAATAISLLSTNFSQGPTGHIRLDTDPLSNFVCREERFASDPSLSYACTGFLVAPDILATAGHCMVNTGESWHETDTYCQAYSWLFDYQTDAQGNVNLTDISPEHIYRCKEVIYAVKDERAPFRDFALVLLERPVRDRSPLPLQTNPLDSSDTLTMIGYPLGTPAKISPGGRVLRNDPRRQSFITNLAAFEGNSGSPVWDGKGKVAGILVGGTPSNSLIADWKRHCSYYNRCDERGENCLLPDPDPSIYPGFQQTGSEVQRIGPVLEMLHYHERNRQQEPPRRQQGSR